MKEYEEEERQKRLGPGGLDPVEVYESLPPVSSQEAFAHLSFIFSPNRNHLQSVFWITGDAEMLWWEGYSDVTRRNKQNGPNGKFSYLNIFIFLLNHWPCCLCSVSYQKNNWNHTGRLDDLPCSEQASIHFSLISKSHLEKATPISVFVLLCSTWNHILQAVMSGWRHEVLSTFKIWATVDIYGCLLTSGPTFNVNAYYWWMGTTVIYFIVLYYYIQTYLFSVLFYSSKCYTLSPLKLLTPI